MSATTLDEGLGPTLRVWRERRRLSQLALALDAGVSARHLSFIETGRSKPGREVLLRITECLELPLRERNQVLLAGGYAPAFPERSLDDPALASLRESLNVILTAHEPFPAMVVDRHWDIVAANAAMIVLWPEVDPSLLEPPVNAMRVGLHPKGLARSIVNLAETRAYFLGRLERQVALTGDPALVTLRDEVAGYPSPEGELQPRAAPDAQPIITPQIRVRRPDGTELSFFATVLTFGSAVEVTASELSIELAFPADARTADTLRGSSREQ